MSKYIDPTILFQYRTAPRFSTLLKGLRDEAIAQSMESIFNFFDLDAASGLWLDQLGAYLNIPRPFIVTDSTLIMDDPDCLMDDPDFLMDGTGYADDATYKAYIRGQLLKRNSRFTINDIINVLLYVTGAAKIFIAETVKTVDIYLGVSAAEQKRIFDLISLFDRTWFGLPTGVRLGVFEVIILPDGTDFLIMDDPHCLMDDPNFVMI